MRLGGVISRVRRALCRQPQFPSPERDWQVGDLAECAAVYVGWKDASTGEPLAGPRQGQVLRVCTVTHERGTIWLGFTKFGFLNYPAGYFLKIRPASVSFTKSIREHRPERVNA